jgi:hypothetical protein
LLAATFGNRTLVLNLNQIKPGALAPVLAVVFGTEMASGVLREMTLQLPLFGGMFSALIKVVLCYCMNLHLAQCISHKINTSSIHILL